MLDNRDFAEARRCYDSIELETIFPTKGIELSVITGWRF
jgi:hypothetical protein